MASVFPSGLALMEQHIDVTGQVGTVLVIGSSLGDMMIPLTLGYVIMHAHPLWFLGVAAAVLAVSVAAFIAFVVYARYNGPAYKSLPTNDHGRRLVPASSDTVRLTWPYARCGRCEGAVARNRTCSV